MTTSEYTPPQGAQPTAPPVEPNPVPPPEPSVPATKQRRRGPRSLVSKLTIFVVSLVVVLVAIIGASTFFALRVFLYDRLDQQVENAVGAVASDRPLQACLSGIRLCGIGSADDKYRAPQVEYLTFVGTDGVQLPSPTIKPNESLKVLTVSADVARSLIETPGGVTTVTANNGVQLRVAVRPVSSQYGQAYVLSGLPTAELNRTLGRLVLVEVVIGGSAVLIALLATAAGVRFSLRRLRRVTTTAQDVAKDLSPEGAGLDRRVPDDEPETEVGQLATSFNTMLAAVETQFAARVESEQRMRQFLADASHELRTPLTSIRGYAELTRMQRAVGDNSDENLGRIEFEGNRMSRLVEDLLMLARGDGNGDDRPNQRELIEVAGLIDDSVNGARAAFPAREILVEDVPGDAYVIGDPDQLLRVVRNLVTNAAVHTADDRPITVRALTDEHGVAIQVVDGGPGLPPEDAAHVFERFWRADKARTRVRGGSGLGMSIVASIVRSHGGTVRFDSTVEAGSTVTVWLPGVESS